jgi:hypothetical protein
MAMMLVSWNLHEYLPDERPVTARATPEQTDPHDPHAVRFRSLTALCFALGRRGFTSMILHPGVGETVLCVPFPRRPKTRLTVGAVESSGRWLFTYGNHSSGIDELAETAVRVIAVVSGR